MQSPCEAHEQVAQKFATAWWIRLPNDATSMRWPSVENRYRHDGSQGITGREGAEQHHNQPAERQCCCLIRKVVPCTYARRGAGDPDPRVPLSVARSHAHGVANGACETQGTCPCANLEGLHNLRLDKPLAPPVAANSESVAVLRIHRPPCDGSTCRRWKLGAGGQDYQTGTDFL